MDFYKLALLGHPLGHSRSPELHQNALDFFQLDGEYELLDIPEIELEATLKRLKVQSYAGFNVTIPYKEKIIPLLDDVNSNAAYVGAVNTVKIDQETGKLIGYNTDAPAFLTSLLSYAGASAQFENVFILGSGGAAKACRCAISSILSVDAPIHIITRNVEQAKKWPQRFGPLEIIELTEFIKQPALNKMGSTLFINATPLGQSKDTTPELVFFDRLVSKFSKDTFVYDLVYPKDLKTKTPFVAAAEKRGFKNCSGWLMLAMQAATSFSLWTDKAANPDIMIGSWRDDFQKA